MKNHWPCLVAVVLSAVFSISFLSIALAQGGNEQPALTRFTSVYSPTYTSGTITLSHGAGSNTTLFSPQCVSTCFFDGFDVNAMGIARTVHLRMHGRPCKRTVVSAGNNLFIPTKFPAEWDSYIAAGSAGNPVFQVQPCGVSPYCDGNMIINPDSVDTTCPGGQTCFDPGTGPTCVVACPTNCSTLTEITPPANSTPVTSSCAAPDGGTCNCTMVTDFTCNSGFYRSGNTCISSCSNLCSALTIVAVPPNATGTQMTCSQATTAPCNNMAVTVSWTCNTGYHTNVAGTGCDPNVVPPAGCPGRGVITFQGTQFSLGTLGQAGYMSVTSGQTVNPAGPVGTCVALCVVCNNGGTWGTDTCVTNPASPCYTPPASCPASTASNCVRSATVNGGTSGTCATGYTGACQYGCSNGTWSAAPLYNTCTSGSCAVATIAHCTLPAAASGATPSGVCESGYPGSCAYLCGSGSWSVLSNTCGLSVCAAGTISNCTLGSGVQGATGGSCASGYSGSCSYRCNAGTWQLQSNTCTGNSCSATTIANCVLPARTHGFTAGSCAGGFTGSCVYRCEAGTWQLNINSCAAPTLCSAPTPCGTFPACTAPVCANNAACNDANACTTDTCNNAGTCSSSCSRVNNPVNGVWTGWSACSTSCGTGTQTRTCTNPAPSCGGAACSGVASQSCTNNSGCGCVAPTQCGTFPACAAPVCANNAACNDANACTTDTCNSAGTCSSSCSHTNVPINGGWNNPAWSACSAPYNGTQTRTKTCNNPAPSCGGAACAGSATETQACNVCTVVNGGWNNPAWSACSAPYNGTQTRTKTCNSPAPSCGGAACPGSATETQACNVCTPVNGGWNNPTWSPCSLPYNGTQSRTKTCNSPAPSCGGAACSGSATETQACNVCSPVNCVMSGWGACSASCGSGTQTRSIITAAQCGGTACGATTQPCTGASTTWTPATNIVCSGDTFTQTGNCGDTRSAIGTEPVTWGVPMPSTVCSGVSFGQWSFCGGGDSRGRTMTGTKSCPNMCKRWRCHFATWTGPGVTCAAPCNENAYLRDYSEEYVCVSEHPAAPCVNGGCFIAGTKILMADGTRKEIEKVQKGDMVQGENSPNAVEKTIVLDHDGWLYSFNGGDHFVTEVHPFMTKEGVWKAFNPEAAMKENPELAITELKVGDVVVTRDGAVELTKVDRIWKKGTVYNFVVNDSHVYYADGYLVHNKEADPECGYCCRWFESRCIRDYAGACGSVEGACALN